MPSPRISDFVANFKGGGARPNLYEVILTFPGAIPNNAAAEKLSFTCRSATLPASNLQPIEVPYMGRMVKLAGDRTFDDWNIMVFNDADFLVRDHLERWSNAINAHSGNYAESGWSNPNTYFADAIVNQLARDESILKSYRMEGIFPVQVGEIQLGFDQNNMVEEFNVVFAVNYWSSNTTT
jgi:hypothetical protein